MTTAWGTHLSVGQSLLPADPPPRLTLWTFAAFLAAAWKSSEACICTLDICVCFGTDQHAKWSDVNSCKMNWMFQHKTHSRQAGVSTCHLGKSAFFFLTPSLAYQRTFITTHSAENKCYRTRKYTVCRHVRLSFSLEILQAGAVKGLNVGSYWSCWLHNQNDQPSKSPKSCLMAQTVCTPKDWVVDGRSGWQPGMVTDSCLMTITGSVNKPQHLQW